MTIANYVHGFPHGISIRGLPLLSLYPGKVLWVDSVLGSNQEEGTFDKPMASIAYIYLNDLVTAGDIIVAKPGHIEVISAAAGCLIEIAGTCIVCLGSGSNRATFSFGTAVAASLSITAANTTIINPRFLSAIDNLTNAISIAAADTAIINAEYYDAAGMAATIQLLTSAAADRLLIDGYKYVASTTGTQKTAGFKTVAGTGIVLKNIDIRGDFTNAPLYLSTAALDLTLNNIFVQNTSVTPQPAISIHANSTGVALNVKARTASGVIPISSAAKLSWSSDCEGFSTDGYGGYAMAPATRGKFTVAKLMAAADFTGAATTRFTVTGPIRVTALGIYLTTALPAGGNTIGFQHVATGVAAAPLSGTTLETASAAVGSFLMVDGTAATQVVKSTVGGVFLGAQITHMSQFGIFLGPGVTQTIFSAGPPATGAGIIFMEYEPLTSWSVVT